MTAALELLGGLVGLVVSGTAIVRGASVIGAKLGLGPLVIGLTIVAAGTSAPELAVVWQAANDGDTGLALGSVVGSNIANVLLVLGIVAVISAINVSRQAVVFDAPVMIGASVLVLVLGLDGSIGQVDGIILVVCLVAYITTTIIVSRRNERRGVLATLPAHDHAPPSSDRPDESVVAAAAPNAATPTDPPAAIDAAITPVSAVAQADDPTGGDTRRSVALELFDRYADTFVGALIVFAVGAAGVALSAGFVVSGASSLALSWGVSEVVVGLTVVAVGTSAPEIATSVIAATRGQGDVALGNAIGSNIFNLLFVLGLVSATTSDLPVADSIRRLDLPLMLAVAVLLIPYAVTSQRIERLEGAVFLTIYAAYTAYLVLDGTENDAADWFGFIALVVLGPLALAVIGVQVFQRRWGRLRGRSEHHPTAT